MSSHALMDLWVATLACARVKRSIVQSDNLLNLELHSTGTL